MQRHRFDLVSLVLGAAALAVAAVAGLGLADPFAMAPEAAWGFAVLVPAAVVAILVVQFLVRRLRGESDAGAGGTDAA